MVASENSGEDNTMTPNKIIIFETASIRRTLHNGEWYFSVGIAGSDTGVGVRKLFCFQYILIMI
jgi:hypothetical protein